MTNRNGLMHAALIAEARLPLYSHAQQNAVRECVSSIRHAAEQAGGPLCIQFGQGVAVVATWTFADGQEGVSIRPASEPGIVGQPVAEGMERTALQGDEIVLVFPTVEQANRVHAAILGDTPAPETDLMGLTAEQLCRTPLIEWLVPTTEEWNACETMQDRYDLVKRRVQMAFTDAALSTTEGSADA